MSSKAKVIFSCASVWLMAVGMSSSMAATSTSAIAVSATVNALCQIGSAPVAAPDYATTVKSAQAALKVQCDMNVPYTVSVDVKTKGMTGSLPVASTSNADAPLQTDALPPARSTGYAAHKSQIDERLVTADDRYKPELNSELRGNLNVVVTTVTY